MTPKKTGFSFGVILGAVVGTGALILSQSKEGKVIRNKVLEKLDEIKESYPDEIEKLESVVSDALNEAKSVTQEIRTLDTTINETPKTKPKTKTKAKPKKRRFVKNSD